MFDGPARAGDRIAIAVNSSARKRQLAVALARASTESARRATAAAPTPPLDTFQAVLFAVLGTLPPTEHRCKGLSLAHTDIEAKGDADAAQDAGGSVAQGSAAAVFGLNAFVANASAACADRCGTQIREQSKSG